jgi:hypothetical protein
MLLKHLFLRVNREIYEMRPGTGVRKLTAIVPHQAYIESFQIKCVDDKNGKKQQQSLSFNIGI